MDTKLCVACGSPLPSLRRSNRRYCGVGCRVRAHKIRVGRGARQQRQRQGSHSAPRNYVGLVLSAFAVDALRRELAEVREQREQARAALELHTGV